MGAVSQYFTAADYLLSLPILLLTLFAIGVLLIDLMLPAEWKWFNSVLALVGVAFSAVGVVQVQRSFQRWARAWGASAS